MDGPDRPLPAHRDAHDLTPSFERETGQVTLGGLPYGAAGEALLTPVPGLDLTFDRVDGRLCRAVVDVAGADGSVAVGKRVAAMLIRLFGPEAPGIVLGAAVLPSGEPQEDHKLSLEPGLAETLSSLACVYGAPATSPPLAPVLDVAAEVESLEKDCTYLAGPHWLLDPGMVPEGLFQFGLSPYSDLAVLRGGGQGRIVVEASLAPGADRRALADCQARLVIPSVRRILAQACFTVVGSKARAGLRPPFPPDELAASWIEVVEGERPVYSLTGHWTRRALRWADAALRAERASAAPYPAATGKDWAALAAAAWGRCRLDWAAAGDLDRAHLAAQRQAAPIRGRFEPLPFDHHEHPPVLPRRPRAERVGGAMAHDDQRGFRNSPRFKEAGDPRCPLVREQVVRPDRARSRRVPVDHHGHPALA